MTVETTPTETPTETGDGAAAPEGAPVLTISEAALAKVLEVRAGEDDPETLCLRIGITGVNGVDYTYDLSFEPLADNLPDDRVYDQGGLTVAIPADSVDALTDAVLDLPSNPGQGGLVIRNPNRPNPLAGANLELTGDTAEKVQTLLAEVVNPQLAVHGGFVSLVGVDDDRVFLTMGGGCQGCAMSQATMMQGVKAAITEAIPEVVDVVDATDHAAGENPFYA